MTESLKVHRTLSKIKSREDIGVVHKTFETSQNDNLRNKDFKNSRNDNKGNKGFKKPSPKEIVRLRKENCWKELHDIAIAKAYASVIAKLSFEFSGKEVHEIVEKRIAEKWASTFIKLDSMLHALRIPSILYLRIHLKLSNGRIVIPALATHAAINRFADYLERDLSQKYIMPKDIQNAVAKLSLLNHSDALRQLLTEYNIGKNYMKQTQRYSALLDEEMSLLLELRNLPGGYLITLDSLSYFRENNLLSDEVCDRVDAAKQLLMMPGVQKAFFREVSGL